MMSHGGRAATRRVRSKPFQAAVGGLAAALVLASCSGGDETSEGDGSAEAADVVEGGTLRIGIADEATTLDLGVSTTTAAHYRSVNVMEGLYAFDADWEPQPMLVEESTLSDDGLTFTMTLREVLFHDGSPLTADDAVATILRGMTTRPALAEIVAEAVATDERTVELRLNFPSGHLLDLLADRGLSVFKKEVLDQYPEGEPVEFDGMIGTGPYRYVEWQQDQVLVMERFEDYEPRSEPASGLAGEKIAYADRIEIRPIIDAAARKSSMDAGQLDAANAMPQDLIETYDASSLYTPVYQDSGYVIMNFNHQDSPMADLKLRQAIHIGVDIDEVAAAQGPEEVWNVYPGLPIEDVGYTSEAGTENWAIGDKEAAEQLIAESDYNGETITVTMNQSTQSTYNAGIVIVEELKAMGINAEVNLVDLATLNSLRSGPSGWDIIMGAETQLPSLLTARPNMRCGNPFGGFCDERMEEAANALVRAVEQEEIQEAHDEFQRLYNELVPAMKLTEYRAVWLRNDKMIGQNFMEVWPHYWNVQAPEVG